MIAVVQAQGQLLRMGVLGHKSSGKVPGAVRGKVVRFSKSSRRRLLRLTARLLVGKIKATFITLTFSGTPSYEKAKVCFKRFVMRLTRKFETCSALWRMETQGRGALHFHIIVFKMGFWKQDQLQQAWEECTEELRSIVHIRLLRGTGMVFRYVAKYVAKVDKEDDLTSLDCVSYPHGEGKESSGRWWGVIRRKALPFAPVRTAILTGAKTIRSLSSFAWALMNVDNKYNSLGFHLFANNTYALLEWAKEQGGCDLEEWVYSVNDHTMHDECWEYYPDDIFPQEDKHSRETDNSQSSRGRYSATLHPLISGWTALSSFVTPEERLYPFFDECGIISAKSND